MSQEFEVRPFAFMRLTHDAVRDGVQRCQSLAAELPGAARELRAVYDETRRCIEVHASIEERGFFPLLDRLFDDVALQAGFRDEHAEEEARHRAILSSFEALDAGLDGAGRELAWQLSVWEREVETHLVHEEEVMMPLTQRVADTLDGRAEAVRAIIDTDRANVEAVLVPWVASRLEATKPFGPVRMFVSALQVSHPPEQRLGIEQRLRAALQPATVARLEQVGALG